MNSALFQKILNEIVRPSVCELKLKGTWVTQQDIHAQKPSNVAELKLFCTEEWAKIPPQRCERLIASYCKRLIAVIAAKGGSSY